MAVDDRASAPPTTRAASADSASQCAVRPTASEVKHYRWWLQKELELVHPRLVVALGATAVLALSGKATPILRSRGPAEFGFITVHPSYLLRIRGEADQQEAFRSFVADLSKAKQLSDERKARQVA